MGRPVLTNQEKQVIIFVVTAFLLGLVVKSYRHHHPVAEPAPAKPAASSPAAHAQPMTAKTHPSPAGD